MWFSIEVVHLDLSSVTTRDSNDSFFVLFGSAQILERNKRRGNIVRGGFEDMIFGDIVVYPCLSLPIPRREIFTNSRLCLEVDFTCSMTAGSLHCDIHTSVDIKYPCSSAVIIAFASKNQSRFSHCNFPKQSVEILDSHANLLNKCPWKTKSLHRTLFCASRKSHQDVLYELFWLLIPSQIVLYKIGTIFGSI